MVDYRGMAAEAAQKYGIPPELFLKQLGAESGWNPSALSPKGAQGIGQLMPGTARELGVDPNDPVQNIDGAARYLRQQYDEFGQWDLALAAYNAGPGAVRKYGGVPPFAETRNYVSKITGGGGAGGDSSYADNALGGYSQPGQAPDMNAIEALMKPKEPEPPQLRWQGHDPAMFMNRRSYG